MAALRRLPYWYAVVAVLLGGLALPLHFALGQQRFFNVRDVEPRPSVLDPGDFNQPDSRLWVLNFRFKDPRITLVDIPARGCRVCLYLWYQVINRSGEPRTFVPEFVLVTHDKKSVHEEKSHLYPTAMEAISRIEDRTGYYQLKNSVTIYANPIPVSFPDGPERAVTGIAIWDDVDPDSNHFSIFVKGLSNAVASTDPIPPGKEVVTRTKTLQLEFRRLGDRFFQESREFQFQQPPRWIYRAWGRPDPRVQ